jgi:hypothetical protein
MVREQYVGKENGRSLIWDVFIFICLF